MQHFQKVSLAWMLFIFVLPSASFALRVSDYPPVGAGYYHSIFALTSGSGGSAGNNKFGALGDGTYDSSSFMTSVKNIGGLRSMSAGADFSLGLSESGVAWSFGIDGDGELGNGSPASHSNLPTAIIPPATSGVTVKAVSAGNYHAIELLTNGTVMTWGFNINGQLGDGTSTQRETPVFPVSIGGATAVAAGGQHTLAVVGGTVKSWGWNISGQLGDGTTTNHNQPVSVSGLTAVTEVAAGAEHSLALKNDNTVWAWGSNTKGQLGNGTTTSSTVPVQVQGLPSNVVKIAAGGSHSLALTSSGEVYAWGGNDRGQLGLGDYTNRNTATKITTLSRIVAISAGFSHSLAVITNGSVRAWGSNAGGQFANGGKKSVNVPTLSNPIVYVQDPNTNPNTLSATHPPMWTTFDNIEDLHNTQVGAGITGWYTDISISFDPNRGGNAGDPAGWIDLFIYSRLYGEFLTGTTMYLTGATQAGCSAGRWAAYIPAGVKVEWSRSSTLHNYWGNFGWEVGGTTFCFQEPSPQKKITVVVTPVNARIPITSRYSSAGELGALWKNIVNTGSLTIDDTTGAGISSYAANDTSSSFKWTGLASINNHRSAIGEWNSQVASQSGSIGGGSYIAIGGNSISNLRNTIRRRAASITKGLTPITTAPSSPLISLDQSQSVLFYDFSGQSETTAIDGNFGKTLTIGGDLLGAGGIAKKTRVSGLKTIVIKGGNLHITSDMYYENSNNLVVFVVLADEKNPKNGGNIYVDPAVTNMVGTFIADGSVLSMQGGQVLSAGSGSTSRDLLRRQLLIYGSVASANTVGGTKAVNPQDRCPYGSDWQRNHAKTDACSDADAAKYDFMTLRSFYVGTSLKPEAMDYDPAMTDINARSCATRSGETAFPMPRLKDSSSTWSAVAYAWAGKRKCYPSDSTDSNLRRAPSSAELSSVILEYNASARNLDIPILQEDITGF